MSGLKYNSGKSKSIGQALPVDRTNLNPSLYEGMVVYDVNKQLYYSNGSIWILVQPANVQFSDTGNNALFMNGKQEIQLSVNSAVFSTNSIFAYTANNSTFAYGKQEAQLSVNAATFAVNAVSASLALGANNSTYAYGKQESQLSVANSAVSNNSTYAYGKQESQLSVANSALSNNSTYAYGKQEAQLSVSAANNSSFLLGRTWASPADIGTSVASNGIFTNVTVLNNLTVNGTMTVVNTSITTSNNTFIILNDAQASPLNDMGLIFQRYETPSATDYNVALFWDEATKQIIIGKADNTITTNTQNLSITSDLFSVSENGLVTINGQLNANVAVTNALTIKTLTANGSTGTDRQFLTANGTGGTYWYTLEQALPIANDNTSSIKYYLPMSNGVSGNWSNAVIADARLSFTPSTGTLTANQGAFTDALISGNTYINKLSANGSIGGAGQVLLSNGTGVYWENSLTIAPRAGFGLSSNATHYQVSANSGIIANTNGTYVNAAYIAAITSNNATYAFGKQEGQLSVNAAVYATNSQFSYTANNANFANVALLANNSTFLAGRTWASPLVIGADVANNAFFSNTVANRAQIGALAANGSVGTFGQILASNGTGLYWTSNPPGVAIPLTQNNNSTSTWYFPMSNSATGSWSEAAVADGKLSFVPTTGTLTVGIANTSKAIIANAVITAIFANGSFGGVNQVLTSNGSSVYWTGDTNTMYDLIGVSNTIQNAGILRLVSSSLANDDVLFVGGGTTVVSSNGTHIVISTVDQFKGTVTSITSGNGLVGSPITASGTLAVGSGAGISVNVDDVAVNAKDGLTANASGLYVNNDFIRALSTISVVNNAIYLNGKTEDQLNANSALSANNANFLGGKSAEYWSSVALGNTTADYTWSGTHQYNRSIFMANAVSSYIEWNDAGLAAPSATASWGAGTKLALWQKFGPADVGFGIGIEPGAIWYSANNTSSSHKWYANTQTIMVANTSGLFVNGTIYGVFTSVVTSANNSTYAYGKQESQLRVANAVFAGTAANATLAFTTNNATYAYGKQESQLTVAVAANATFATTAQNVLGAIENANNSTFAYGRQQGQLSVNNAIYLGGKQEAQLSVANAVFALVANSVLGSISLANNSTYAYGKQESQLSVATAQNVLGSVATANNATYAYGKQESQLYVANAVFATTAQNVIGGTLNANNATYAYGKQESQLSVSLALNANNSAYLSGRQESQLRVANAVFATTAQNVIGAIETANNATYAYGKQESQLRVANAVFATTAQNVLGAIETANNATFAYGKQESQLRVANAVFATTAQNVIGAIENANNATYAYGKQESQLAVASATIATTSANAGFATTANNALRFNGKQESQLSVATAVTSNNSTYAYGKQEGQLSVSTANNATYAYGKQETQLNVGLLNSQNGTYYSDIPARLGYTPVQKGTGTGQGANIVKIGWLGTQLGLEVDSTNYGATWPINVSGSSSSGTALTANNSTYAYGKQESQLSVATAANATQAANAALLNSQNGAYYLNAGNLAAGTVPTARLGTGTASSSTWLRGDQTWTTIPNTTTWSSNITWNGGINVGIAAESSFDLSGSGIFGVNDGGSGYSIKSAIGTQVEIGAAGTLGLKVWGPLTSTGTMTATDFIISSDKRYKNVFGNITNALTAVNSLNGVTYTYNELSGKDTETVRAGVIAQDVEAVLPQAVYTDADGYKSVSYDSLVPLLIEAIKELTARVEELENK